MLTYTNEPVRSFTPDDLLPIVTGPKNLTAHDVRFHVNGDGITVSGPVTYRGTTYYVQAMQFGGECWLPMQYHRDRFLYIDPQSPEYLAWITRDRAGRQGAPRAVAMALQAAVCEAVWALSKRADFQLALAVVVARVATTRVEMATKSVQREAAALRQSEAVLAQRADELATARRTLWAMTRPDGYDWPNDPPADWLPVCLMP